MRPLLAVVSEFFDGNRHVPFVLADPVVQHLQRLVDDFDLRNNLLKCLSEGFSSAWVAGLVLSWCVLLSNHRLGNFNYLFGSLNLILRPVRGWSSLHFLA